jgi:hypothetical protein
MPKATKRRQIKPLREFNYQLVEERMDGLLIKVDRDLQRRLKQAATDTHRRRERFDVL